RYQSLPAVKRIEHPPSMEMGSARSVQIWVVKTGCSAVQEALMAVTLLGRYIEQLQFGIYMNILGGGNL
ncbi:hypothetical protein ACJX0J_006169, partial [Zea mays]